jgi:SAM-dependent methyltransferase
MKKLSLLAILLAFLIQPAAASSEQEIVDRCARMLREFRAMPEQQIPRTVLRRARGLAVMTVAGRNAAACSGHHLLDLCCGNGLVTFELAQYARHVTGIDFAQHLIDEALRFKPAGNITYRVGKVIDSLTALSAETVQISRVLTNDSLAYFAPADLDTILLSFTVLPIKEGFRFLITGIPNDERKWNFYNTPERVARYEENLKGRDTTNDGLGRWWTPGEIRECCAKAKLSVEVLEQPASISNYRMDALITLQ